jgi:hypothetical protein
MAANASQRRSQAEATRLSMSDCRGRARSRRPASGIVQMYRSVSRDIPYLVVSRGATYQILWLAIWIAALGDAALQESNR